MSKKQSRSKVNRVVTLVLERMALELDCFLVDVVEKMSDSPLEKKMVKVHEFSNTKVSGILKSMSSESRDVSSLTDDEMILVLEKVCIGIDTHCRSELAPTDADEGADDVDQIGPVDETAPVGSGDETALGLDVVDETGVDQNADTVLADDVVGDLDELPGLDDDDYLPLAEEFGGGGDDMGPDAGAVPAREVVGIVDGDKKMRNMAIVFVLLIVLLIVGCGSMLADKEARIEQLNSDVQAAKTDRADEIARLKTLQDVNEALVKIDKMNQEFILLKEQYKADLESQKIEADRNFLILLSENEQLGRKVESQYSKYNLLKVNTAKAISDKATEHAKALDAEKDVFESMVKGINKAHRVQMTAKTGEIRGLNSQLDTLQKSRVNQGSVHNGRMDSLEMILAKTLSERNQALARAISAENGSSAVSFLMMERRAFDRQAMRIKHINVTRADFNGNNLVELFMDRIHGGDPIAVMCVLSDAEMSMLKVGNPFGFDRKDYCLKGEKKVKWNGLKYGRVYYLNPSIR